MRKLSAADVTNRANFSPNRVICGPGMHGSMSSGVQKAFHGEHYFSDLTNTLVLPISPTKAIHLITSDGSFLDAGCRALRNFNAQQQEVKLT